MACPRRETLSRGGKDHPGPWTASCRTRPGWRSISRSAWEAVQSGIRPREVRYYPGAGSSLIYSETRYSLSSVNPRSVFMTSVISSHSRLPT